MTKFVYYLLLVILIIYIVSPVDLYPLFFDDIIASGILFYLWHKNSKRKRQRRYSYSRNQSQNNKENKTDAPLGLEEAYRTLGIRPGASLKDVTRAYKEKITRTHPDKAGHLSEELQEKAKELTIKLNIAFDIIKRSKKG